MPWVIARASDVCPVFGLELDYRGTGGPPRPNSPTLDRLRGELGYVPGNVRVISHRANALKRDGTLDELRALVRWLEAELNP